MVVYNRDSKGNWVSSSTGQSASSLGYSSGKSSSSSSTTKTNTSTTSTGSAAGAHNTSLSSGIANHTTLVNGQPNTAKTSTTTPSSGGSSSSGSSGAPYAPTSLSAGDTVTISKTPTSSGGSVTVKSSGGASLSGGSSSPVVVEKTPYITPEAATVAQAINAGESLTVKSGNQSTVQPVFVSGASENNTYRIIEDTGSYQIAASGISLADASQYYAEKAASALASGDAEGYLKYSQSAGDFAAAANYETASNIRATYGVTGGDLEKGHTDLSYDATYSLALDPETRQTYLAKNSVIEYIGGNGLLGSTQAKTYYEPMAVSRTLGEVLVETYPEGLSAFQNAINGNSVSDSQTKTSGSGNTNAFKIGVQDLLKENDGSTYTGESALAGMGRMVDSFVSVPETLAENYGIVGALGGGVFSMFMPDSLIGTIKKVTDGRVNEVTGEDVLWSILDAVTLIPSPLMALKGLKLLKPASFLTQAGLGGYSLVNNFLNPDDGDSDTPAPKQTDTPTPEVPYPVVVTVREQTNTPTPAEQNGEYDMSGITDMLAALFAQKTSGAGGGSGVTLVTNEAQPVDYSGVFRYIIPAIVIIGIIIVASKLLGNKKKGGSAA